MARPVKLYNHALAPNPRRVRIFAAEKGIELSLEEVDILAGQSRMPEFLAKNSSGGVPVLELDDGSYLSESVAICGYLEGLHPEPNLLGRDLREQAEIERFPLLAPRAVWRRPLSVDKCPSLMTYAAVPQMHRTRRQVRRLCQLVMTRPNSPASLGES